ncbi:class I SAM-dependent methyltransferase [Candidatus Pelagibacter sp.]|nr:class I SAM-dependent methyltransferase [Candidatus Pelagibacter sp.]
MIKRSSKQLIDNEIIQNPNWKVLDIGCGFTAHEKANVVCDVQDLSNFYKDKNFVKLNDKKLPFRDKEFDFVIASHVIEHVEDVIFFIKELERVSSKGYIEIPTPLEDNLVFENKNDHIWHVEFNDIESKLLIKKRIQYIEPLITVSTAKKLAKFFKQSLILELFWVNSIEFDLVENNNFKFEKISRLSLMRKFFSKIIRNLIR